THKVDLSKFPGRRTVLAIWNIGDTPNAFYNCIDLNIGGGGSGQEPPASSPASPPAEPGSPPASPPPSQSQPTQAPVDGAEWQPGVTNLTGDWLAYKGTRYRCRQRLTPSRSWEPEFPPALWQALCAAGSRAAGSWAASCCPRRSSCP